MQDMQMFLMYGGQKDRTKREIPTQQYLDKIFKELDDFKIFNYYKEIPTGTIYQGFKTIPIQKLQSKTIKNHQKIDGKSRWKRDGGNVLYYEQSCPLKKIYQNGFFGAFYEAYINHGDVKITPDDVWMAILLFFSKYVDNNSEKLRKAFVQHQGKKELVIQTNKESQYQWNQFFDKVIVAIRSNTVKGVTENFECSFTTTDRFFTLFSTAVIMNSYKKYFNYTRMMCVCGIQNIHMGGCLQDWQKVSKKLAYLKQFDVNGGLKKYVERLLPVIDQFIQTFKGQANLEFWNNLYHERQDPHSGAYRPKKYVNGWILRFFTTQDYITSTPAAIQEIDVPIKVIQDNMPPRTVNLVGGCLGISIEGSVYRPHFSFAIVEEKNKNNIGKLD